MEDSAEGAGSGDINGRLANRRRGKGTGNPGKPGKKLRLADLQSQFGVGLKVFNCHFYSRCFVLLTCKNCGKAFVWTDLAPEDKVCIQYVCLAAVPWFHKSFIASFLLICVGLKWLDHLQEAANRLGICPTTLKRACRRHGIQRWPRRQLARLTRAIDQIRTSGDTAPPVQGVPDQPVRSTSRGRAASEGAALVQSPQSAPTSTAEQVVSEPGPDTRWSALDQLIPTFSHPLDDASVHGPSKAHGGMSAALPPAHEGSLSPALIHQSQGGQHETALQLTPPVITPQSAEVSAVDLSLHMGLSSLAAADPWGAANKDDPWADAHIHKLGFASVTAEPGSSMHLDGDSLDEQMIGAEEDTVHGMTCLHPS